MANESGPGRQNQDRNGLTGSSMLLWAGLIVATGLLVVMLLAPYFSREIAAADLLRLIKASPHEQKGGEFKEGARDSIDVLSNEGSKSRPVRYSKLRQVVVKERVIIGQVDAVELTPQGDKQKLVPDEKSYAKG